MTPQKVTDDQSNIVKVSVVSFIILFGAYIVNVLIGKAKIVYGWQVFHLESVGEFLLLFVAAIAFIVAALHSEAVRKKHEPKKSEGENDGEQSE